MSEQKQAAGALGSNAGLGPVPERDEILRQRDEILRQLDDRTNQTWSGKRERWAALVRAQDAEIQNLRAALQWYANGGHVDKTAPNAWHTVSGEPQNWWCDEAGAGMVEDGAQLQALEEDDEA